MCMHTREDSSQVIFCICIFKNDNIKCLHLLYVSIYIYICDDNILFEWEIYNRKNYNI